MRITILLVTSILSLLLVACGQKGPVRPLGQQWPQTVQAASLLQRGDRFQLQWQMPKHNQDGSPLSDLETIEVRRLFSTEAEFCAECPTPWPLIAQIHPQLAHPAQRVGQRYLLSDRGASLGQTARYRLTAHNRQGDAGLPLTLKRVLREPVNAPIGLRISAHDKSLELHWQPTAVPKGAFLLGYQVYRRSANHPFLPLPTNLRPLKKTTFSDFGLQNDQTYYYRIRSLFDFDGQKLESLPSPEISATPAAG